VSEVCYFLLRDRIPLPGRTLDKNPEYWRGLPVGDAELAKAVAAGYDIGVLPERSGLVILDCDVRLEAAETSPGEFELRQLPTGMENLARAAHERGRRIPDTRVVRSPSGGWHLWFRQNPLCRVTSRGHRPGWLIDVKASPNTYAVAPPSKGYAVLLDYPVARLPYWLARHITGGLPRAQVPVPAGWAGGPLPPGMRDAISAYIAEGNTAGGWNTRIFLAACWLRESGMGLGEICAVVTEAAAPRDDRELGKATATIRSAWRRG
jgi:hypothetical protein